MKNIISAKIRPVGEINVSSELLNKLLVEPKIQPPIIIKPELLSPKSKFWLAFYSKASSTVTNEEFDLLSFLISDQSKFEEIVKKAEAKFYSHFENNLNAFSASWSKSLQEKIYDKIHIRIISLSYNSLDIVFRACLGIEKD